MLKHLINKLNLEGFVGKAIPKQSLTAALLK